MTAQQLLANARALTEHQKESALKSIVEDDRFPAVLRLLIDWREEYITAASKQQNAMHAGVQAHALGSIHCAGELIEQFCGKLPQPPKRKRSPAPDVVSE